MRSTVPTCWIRVHTWKRLRRTRLANHWRDLIAEGVLAQPSAELASEALPLERSPICAPGAVHQKVAAGRNIVVCYRTGSGKTESFLLPILDSLVRERERGILSPGVRALLLYPMNALANDQMKRLHAYWRLIQTSRLAGIRVRPRMTPAKHGRRLRSSTLMSRSCPTRS